MITRRLVAAFVAFILVSILAGPAFAGVWTAVTGPMKGECCCSKPVESPRPTVQGEPCSCPACACSVDEAPPFGPFEALDAAIPPVFVAIATSPTFEVVKAPVATPRVTTLLARGPPTSTGPPLYILYDTLLI